MCGAAGGSSPFSSSSSRSRSLCCWHSVDVPLTVQGPSCVVSISSALRCSSRAVTVQMSLGRSDFRLMRGRSRRWSFWIWGGGGGGEHTLNTTIASSHILERRLRQQRLCLRYSRWQNKSDNHKMLTQLRFAGVYIERCKAEKI